MVLDRRLTRVGAGAVAAGGMALIAGCAATGEEAIVMYSLNAFAPWSYDQNENPQTRCENSGGMQICIRRRPESQIVLFAHKMGSQPADDNPNIVLFKRPDGGVCHGTIVGKRRMLTAKHCTRAGITYQITYSAGTTNSITCTPHGEVSLCEAAAPIGAPRPEHVARPYMRGDLRSESRLCESKGLDGEVRSVTVYAKDIKAAGEWVSSTSGIPYCQGDSGSPWMEKTGQSIRAVVAVHDGSSPAGGLKASLIPEAILQQVCPANCGP